MDYIEFQSKLCKHRPSYNISAFAPHTISHNHDICRMHQMCTVREILRSQYLSMRIIVVLNINYMDLYCVTFFRCCNDV